MLNKILFIIFFAVAIHAQDVDKVIQNIQTKFSTIDDLKANFTQNIYSALNENSITLTGKFYFKKENNLRIEVNNRLIVSDGSTVWNFDKSANKIIISDYDSDYTSFSLPAIINSYPEICKKEIVNGTSSLTVIKLIPDNDELNFKSAIISLNKNDIVEKVEIIDFNDMKFVFELDSIQLNNDLSEQLFKVNPSNGVEVIDLR